MKGLQIAGLVLGVVAICLFYVPIWNICGLICGIVGLILSILGKKKAVAAGAGTGLSRAGLICSIIGIVLCVIGFFVCTVAVLCVKNAVESSSDWSELEDALQGLEQFIF